MPNTFVGEKKMKITEKEFDAVEQGLCVASNEDMLDENVAYPAFEKMKKVYERYHFLMDKLGMYEREEPVVGILRAYKEQFGEREWLKKIAKQKEINKMVDEVESAAVKAAHKVMEQYSEAFEKLAENKE